MMIHGDPEFVLTLHSVIEFIGTFAFALSGIRLAASKHYDWLGGFVCGVAVAIGGGTIRDVMLGVRPFWMLSPIYLICTLFAQLVVIACHRYLKRLVYTLVLNCFGILEFAPSLNASKHFPNSSQYSSKICLEKCSQCDFMRYKSSQSTRHATDKK